MSIFTTSKKKKLKKRQELCHDAGIFVEVHYVRETNNINNKFNTLALKSDPKRDKCNEWYENHGNPNTYSEIVTTYFSEYNKDEKLLCEKVALDNNYFSNLSKNKSYHPSKGEVIRVCFAFQLDYEETRRLLRCVDYALSNSQKEDLIIRFFIDINNYDISDLNYVLNNFDLPKINEL